MGIYFSQRSVGANRIIFFQPIKSDSSDFIMNLINIAVSGTSFPQFEHFMICSSFFLVAGIYCL